MIARLPAAYDAVRFAGAAYLLYLGIRALTTRRELIQTESTQVDRWAPSRCRDA